MPEDHDEQTPERKLDHIRICLTKDVNFQKSNGFERFEFIPNATPEINRDDIDVSTSFLGKPFAAPLLISCMTGGTPQAERINKNLATAAEQLGIGMGVGSQRAMLRDPELAKTYHIRGVAPNIFLAGNIGGAQLANYKPDEIIGLIESIKADALYVHLNPAQELVQPEGDRDWRGILARIAVLAKHSPVPILAKEVGNGISGATALLLAKAGVAAIDVAGAGGTSWVKVEHFRGSKTAEPFFEWGLPTADCLLQFRQAKLKIPVIASGGIRSGMDVAKAIALGASLAGMARPLLKEAVTSSDAVKRHLEQIIEELKGVMFLVGAKTIADLAKVPLVSGPHPA